MPQVTAIIPNYNGRQLLAKNLPAVLRCLQNNDQLIVVDDASTDDSVEWLINLYHLHPQKSANETQNDYKIWQGQFQLSSQITIALVLVQNLSNLRFARAVNRGVQLAIGQLILLLNSDVRPEKNILSFLLPHFREGQHPQAVFAVACLEKEMHQGKVVLGGKNTLKFQRGMFIHARAKEMTEGTTAWVTGGSGLFDRAKWLELNGLDARYYPAYWEDVDISWQARQHHWLVWFEPRAVVYHNHESTNQDAFGVKRIQIMSWRNANQFVWKNATVWQKFQHLLWWPYWQWKLKK